MALYVAAGRGLLAAHDAGLVHRDFKPDNVLVGSDGRPRVADFGLAWLDPNEVPVTEPRATSTATRSAIAGTPAYMAPEQLAGESVDARADQFAFCASLWEALFGERPFADRETDRTTDRGEPPTEPRAPVRDVPKHIVAALRRGMEKDRAARWPSLAPLLVELRRDPRRRRVGVVVAGAAIAATLAIGVSRGGDGDTCNADVAIADAWSSERSATVRAALVPPNTPIWIERVATRALGTLDDWTARWLAQYRVVCEASRVWSPSLVDRGVQCLAQSRRELVAIVDVLATTPGIAGRADQLVDRLGAPERCADPGYLSATIAPPADPVQATQIDLELAELARIHALELAGRTKQARELATAVLARARKLEYPPLVARAQYRRGHVTMAARDYTPAFADLHDGYFAARAVHDEVTAAGCAATSALALLNLSRDVEAVDWAHLAEAETGATTDPAFELETLGALAVVTRAHGDPKRALAYAERHLAIARRIDRLLPKALQTRSGVLDVLGRSADALADLDEAIRLQRERFGEHPWIGDFERERALVLLHLHRFDDALAAARRSLEIAEHLEGADSVSVNNSLAILGTCLKDVKRYDEALRTLDRSLALTRKLDGPRSYNTASDLNNRADLVAQMGRLDEALASWKLSSEIFSEVVGPNSLDVGLVEGNVANALFQAHRVLDAEKPAVRALAIMEKTPDSPLYAQALIAIGMIEVVKGELARAKESLAKGLAKLDDDPRWRIRGRVALAKVSVALGDREAARALLAGARADADAAKSEAVTVAEIERMIGRVGL